jgi:hypothetical protein
MHLALGLSTEPLFKTVDGITVDPDLMMVNKSSLTSTVRNFSIIYLFILFLFLISTTRHVSAHP